MSKDSPHCRDHISPEELVVARSFFDKSRVVTVYLDRNRRVTYANPAARALLGLPDDQPRAGLRAEDLVVPEQVDLVRKALARLTEGLDPRSLQLRVARMNGSIVPMEVHADLVCDNGRPAGFVVFAMDMRRRERRERQIAQQEPLFRTIVEHSHHGFIVVDDNYRFVYANDGMLRILGATRGEVLGHDFREFVHPDSVEMVVDCYVRRQRGEKPPSRYRFKIRRKDGAARVVLINAAAVVDDKGRVRTVAELEDLTQSLQNKQALELSRERYKVLVETMTDGLGIADADGRMIYFNPALVRMLGYESASEIVGAPLGSIIVGMSGERLRDVFERRRKGVSETYEAYLIHRSGRLVPVLISAAPLFDADGKFIGSFGIITDMSALKEAEAEARFLLDLLLHDFGNQMQAIIAGLEMMQQRRLPPSIDRAYEYAMDGALRCMELIEKIRRTEEAERFGTEVVDLARVVRDEAARLQKMYPVKVEVEGLPDELPVVADSGISHMIWNLLENAAKHNPRDDKRVWITAMQHDDLFTLSIADNGPGLDDSAKQGLLDPNRRFGGVGLHLVNRLAARYGVRIDLEDRVEGQPDMGLRVTLHFPKRR